MDIKNCVKLFFIIVVLLCNLSYAQEPTKIIQPDQSINMGDIQFLSQYFLSYDQQEKAIKVIRDFEKLNPNKIEVKLFLAQVYEQTMGYDSAAKVYQEIISFLSEASKTLLEKKTQYEENLKKYNEELEKRKEEEGEKKEENQIKPPIQPFVPPILTQEEINLTHARFQLAKVYEIQGKREQAIQIYEIIAKETPDTAQAGQAEFRRAKLLKEAEKLDEAIKIYENILQRYSNKTFMPPMMPMPFQPPMIQNMERFFPGSDRFKTSLYLASIYEEQKKYEDAEKIYNSLLEDKEFGQREKNIVSYILAEFYITKSANDKAVQVYEQILKSEIKKEGVSSGWTQEDYELTRLKEIVEKKFRK